MIITYDLRLEDSSQEYYELTRQLAEKLENQMTMLDEWLHDFMEYVKDCQVEAVRDKMEYGIELLDLAILHGWIQRVQGEGCLDFSTITYEKLNESMEFMQSSGEFKEEIRRFHNWMGFFAGYNESAWKELWSKLWILVQKIDEWGDCYLAKYLPRLSEYLEVNKTAWQQREDAGLVLRDKTCYYFNMIGAQILNRCYRDNFKFCDKVYIFLPGCVAKQKNHCQAVEKKDGYACVSCSKECQVSKLSKKYPGVRIVYHGSQMENQKVNDDKKIGVVGIACILNLVSGGWKARRLGYIPQCVILNECGCNIHWDKEGIVTSIDEKELARVLS